MSNLIIVAAGKGTRLEPLTTCVSKPLVEVGGRTGISRVLDAWSKRVDEICIIHNDTWLEKYVQQYHAGLAITFVRHKDADGSARALHSQSLPEQFTRDVFVSWCDIWPEVIQKPHGQIATVYVDPTINCRHTLKGCGVVGLFHLPVLDPREIHKGADLYDLIKAEYRNPFTAACGVKDYGDLEKLQKFEKPLCRSFNRLHFGNMTVCKEHTNSLGKKLLNREVAWYTKVRQHGLQHLIPEIDSFSGDILVMKRIDGRQAKAEDTAQIMAALAKLHEVKGPTVSREDQQDEYINTTRERIESIQCLLPDVPVCNGVELRPLDQALRDAEEALELKDEPGVLIHGDCQFSNTMVTKEGCIQFIDPRGYFANKAFWGPADYDYAKVAYALSGYDSFNNDDMFAVSRLDESGIEFEPPTACEVPTKLSDNKTQIIVALIWIKLAAYLPNNIQKMWAAYYHGRCLLEKALR